jgi:hypothetical protein
MSKILLFAVIVVIVVSTSDGQVGYQEPKPCASDSDCPSRCDGLTWHRGFCEDAVCKDDISSCDDDVDCTKV